MLRRALIAGVLAAAALAACSPPATKTAGAPVNDPAEVVRAIYTPYVTHAAQFPEFHDQAPWSADLWAKLEAMMARSNAINEPILDFDPTIDAQDGEVSDVVVTTDGMVQNSHATVRANFTNLGEHKEIVYDLVWENNGWRVDNIRTSAWDLRQIASAPNADATPQ